MHRRSLFLLLLAPLVFLLPSKPCRAETVFQIGTKDKLFTEFARRHQAGVPVVYRVGQSSPEKDWYAYQPGTFDYVVQHSTREQDWMNIPPGTEAGLKGDPVPVPYQVDFDLKFTPRGKFVLELDAMLVYGRPAAPRYVVEINGHAGSYRLTPQPAPELWWPTGGDNVQYIGYQALEMPLSASYFKQGSNTLTVRCEDGFGIFYDALLLRNESAGKVPAVVSATIEPTVFYKNAASGLVEEANLRITTSTPLGRKTVRVNIGSTQVEKAIEQTGFGDIEATIEVPAPEQPVPATMRLAGAGDVLYRGNFTPQRRWRVYAMPIEQADFGYDEVPARTLEFENRYIDKALEITKQYPEYSYTLDAAGNLDSYLATRNPKQRQQLLEFLRNGKYGVNALYEPFLTGTVTTEELIHELDFALKAGKAYNFPVDSASQTDEPSVTWAFPQILSDAGIKFYAAGSDPIRGSINPIGLLNFHSPFYWEGPNGGKVLVWSGVSYRDLTEMTWEGWNQESCKTGQYQPSVLGLERSLPLFVSQYDRGDYPFDAVFVYGLYNDEVPIRHQGSADVVDLWNKQYAYPKVITATQRDYFSYVGERFGGKIPTYRGDGGAYWEDDVGTDAAATALNRMAQTQILAAEKLESVATWLQPKLQFDYRPFQSAWDTLLLADDFVWSDMSSMSRPFSYLTKYEEDVHRGYGEAAYRQSRDLLTTAADELQDMIQTDGPGAAVFNSESWNRGGFFDYELGMDEALQDPAPHQNIPCGSLESLPGYQRVRCWAANIPAFGYKFYAVVKGHVPAGEPVTLSDAAGSIEGKYYTLQLDPQSGAVAHLIDKTTGQDLVNSSSPYKLNEYLYVSGGDPSVYSHVEGGAGNNDNRLLWSDPSLPVPELTINRQTKMDKPSAIRYPWGIVVTVRSHALNSPSITSTIALNDEQKFVGFDNDVEKVSTLKKEGVYFAYPFSVQKPTVEFQGVTAWTNPVSEMLPGANLQWFTTQGGVRLWGENQNIAWVTLDTSLITLEDINRGLWPSSIEIRNGTVFSYAMNNYWNQSAPSHQGGKFNFRFALTSAPKLSPSETEHLVWEQRSPLFVIRHEYKGWKQTLPIEGAGFLGAAPEGVVVLTVRPAPGEGAYLIRVHNTTGQEVKARLQFPRVELGDAYLGSVLGERVGAVNWSAHEVNLPMARADVKSVVVRVKP